LIALLLGLVEHFKVVNRQVINRRFIFLVHRATCEEGEENDDDDIESSGTTSPEVQYSIEPHFLLQGTHMLLLSTPLTVYL
jgi:hypothetical protein